ncbi:ATP-binding protein [Pseudomonas aeruginosa]
MQTSENREFKVHPGIIKHLIREQAGTLVKALAELVMNCVDAGATRVNLTFSEDGQFTIEDDGRGFQSRAEIEDFFETFGTPHEDGDARFGRFRIGRGQIMAFATTTWRSGVFEMLVDLNAGSDSFGYVLNETADLQSGCVISGKVEKETWDRAGGKGLSWRYEAEDEEAFYMRCSQSEYDLRKAVKFLDIPVFLNGRALNTPPSICTWSMEDEHGYYLFDKSDGFEVYNLGIHALDTRRAEFSVGGIFVSKVALRLNMARNQWLYECPIQRHLRQLTHQHHLQALARVKRLTEAEAKAMLHRVYWRRAEISEQEADLLNKACFIPTLGNKRVSPQEFCSKKLFAMYDGVSETVAEKATKNGGVSILLESALSHIGADVDDDNAIALIGRIYSLCEQRRQYKGRVEYIYFDELLDMYSGSYTVVKDKDLSPVQLAALQALRSISARLRVLVKDKSGERERRMFAGKSDQAEAWTNGLDFIAFDVDTLAQAYLTVDSGGLERLVHVAVHEYCHQAESSIDTHEHSLEFYKLYHDATSSHGFTEIVRICYRKFLALSAKATVPLSSKEASHFAYIKGLEVKVATRKPVPASR